MIGWSVNFSSSFSSRAQNTGQTIADPNFIIVRHSDGLLPMEIRNHLRTIWALYLTVIKPKLTRLIFRYGADQPTQLQNLAFLSLISIYNSLKSKFSKTLPNLKHEPKFSRNNALLRHKPFSNYYICHREPSRCSWFVELSPPLQQYRN